MDKNALSAYRKLVEKEILPEIIKEMKEELTQEELEAICDQLLERKIILENQISESEFVEERKVFRKEKAEVNKAKNKFQDFCERKTKYQNSKEILGERNSYSKTDTDAPS